MKDHYTIGELAAAAEVPSSTVRYYERAGLLEPQGRTGGNYRYYTQDSLSRLRFIRAAQAGGFTIEDVRALLELRECRNPCKEVQELIEHRLEEVSGRMKDLRRVQRALKASLELCRTTAESEQCEVIEELKVKKKRRSKTKRARNR